MNGPLASSAVLIHRHKDKPKGRMPPPLSADGPMLDRSVHPVAKEGIYVERHRPT